MTRRERNHVKREDIQGSAPAHKDITPIRQPIDPLRGQPSNSGTDQAMKPPMEQDESSKAPASKTGQQESKRRRTRSQRIRARAVNVIMVCLVGIILVSGYQIARTLYHYWTARHAYHEIAKTANVDPDQFTGVIDFAALRKKNEDITGWIYQKDTVINYPIVQGDDNDTYLYTRYDKEYSGGGTIFIDYRCPANFKGFNTIIYGHHMKDGSMFRSLRGYTKEDGYYDDHKTFELITPKKKYHLIVFSAYITEATSDTYTYDFPDRKSKQQYIDVAFDQSKLPLTQRDVPVTTDDRIVTLSTCAYDFDEARYVVQCKVVPWTKAELQKAKDTEARKKK